MGVSCKNVNGFEEKQFCYKHIKWVVAGVSRLKKKNLTKKASVVSSKLKGELHVFPTENGLYSFNQQDSSAQLLIQ